MKLHIGCGERYLPGFQHLDIRPYPHVDYISRADDLSIFANNSVQEIYACHILEHFTRKAITGVLEEWNRVLCSGGVLRVAVPNFEAITQEYLANGDLERIMGLLYGGQNYEFNFHYQVYDFQRLETLLKGAGFSSVERYRWQDFLPNGYDDFSRAYLPYMDFEHGRLMSFNVVAKKI